jgi:LacI family transcriptional regulator
VSPAPRFRRLAAGDVPSVAILIESSRESGRALLRGIAEYIHVHRRWSVFWEPSGLTEVLPRITSRLDGLILRDIGVTSAVLKMGIPTVVMGHTGDEFPGCINVLTGAATIAKMGLEHLLSRGFSSYAFCGLAVYPQKAVPWSEERSQAFCDLVSKAGMPCHTYLLPLVNVPDWDREREKLRRWLKALPRPVGCMAANDDVAGEVAAACKHLGLAVPDEVAIIGADNDELACGLADPPLSSIAVGFERAGFEAADALDRAMRSGRVGSSRIIAHALHVVARRSTDSTAVEDPNLARALRFIRDRAGDSEISVQEIAVTAGLSRRALERRFREKIGKTVAEHVRELRINRIAQMLIETNLPVSRIAEATGFHDVQHFARYFRSVQKVTPLAFRKAHKV